MVLAGFVIFGDKFQAAWPLLLLPSILFTYTPTLFSPNVSTHKCNTSCIVTNSFLPHKQITFTPWMGTEALLLANVPLLLS
jgi:hypothetical protein